MTEEKPYTLSYLIGTLIALATEGAAMVADITWLALHDPGMGMGVTYISTALIALFSVGLGTLQIHSYRQEQRNLESED